jgi:serine phosphatase RsbU (regulator of sigma subunit)
MNLICLRKYIILFSLFFLGYGYLPAQVNKLDSLESLLAKTTVDTARANLLSQIAWEYKLNDPEKSKKQAEEALAISLKTGYEPIEAASYNVLGVYYYLKHNYKSGRNYFEKALKLYKKLNNIKGLGSCYSNIASILTETANYDSAIIYAQISLQYRMELKKEKPIADCYTNLGNIYNLKGDYALAAENLFKAVKVYERINDSYGLGMSYYNIARTFYMQGKQDDAIRYVQKSRVERIKMGDKSGVATTYLLEGSAKEQQRKFEEAAADINKAIAIEKEVGDTYNLQYSYSVLANIFFNYKQFDLALEYYLKSREIAVETGNTQAISTLDYAIGSVYAGMGDMKKALEYQLNSLKVSTEIKAKEDQKNSLLALSQTYSKMKRFDLAYDYLNQYMAFKDTLMNEANTNQLNQLQTQYESEKKQKEIELFRKNDEIQNERIARQNVINYTVIAGLLLVLVLAFISFKRYREKKRANEEITEQKEIIEEKNKEILDSIHYAKRIQKALLASDNLLKKNLPEYFVLYKPKDIVSGDFYWATETSDSGFILATCDCTGHGVPGAFMSLLNISKLNETINERKITQPDQVFNNVREEIINALSSEDTEEKSQDGMDAVLCAYDFKELKMQFAAANNPLIIVRNNQMLEFRPDKFPVGAHQGELKPFGLKEVSLQKGDCIYTFTDGFADQFGGDKGKKMMTKNFKHLLVSVSSMPMTAQKAELEKAFDGWKGTHQQIDDVLVIGVRV